MAASILTLPVTNQNGLNKRLQSGQPLAVYSEIASIADHLILNAASNPSGTGYDAQLAAGNGDATSNGGGVAIYAADGGALAGKGGDVQIYGGTSTEDVGGNVTVQAGKAGSLTATSHDGGFVRIFAGDGTDGGAGGYARMTGGNASLTGAGGPIQLYGGGGGATNGAGGEAIIAGGSASDGAGGAATLAGGKGGGANDGGAVSIVGGLAGDTGTGGAVNLAGGDGGATSGNGGDVAIAGGGPASTGSGGLLTLSGGSANGVGQTAGDAIIDAGKANGGSTEGNVLIASEGASAGGSNAASVYIGNSATNKIYLHGAAAQNAGSIFIGAANTLFLANAAAGYNFGVDRSTSTANGGGLRIFAGDALAAGGIGGKLALVGGAGEGGANYSGPVTIDAGPSNTSSVPGYITIGGRVPGPFGHTPNPTSIFIGGSSYATALQTVLKGSVATADAGGSVQIAGGNGTTGGGDIDIRSGSPTLAGNDSAAVVIQSGSITGNATTGSVSIASSNSAGSAGNSGEAIVRTGYATGSGLVGTVKLYSGMAGSTGDGGLVSIYTGDGGTATGNGGAISISTGDARAAGNGGAISIESGMGGSTDGNGGGIEILSGAAANDGAGGAIWIACGAGIGEYLGAPLALQAGQADGTLKGGTVYVLGGGAGTGAAGNVVIKGGPADAGVNYGSVFIGTDPDDAGTTRFVTINSTTKTKLQANGSDALVIATVSAAPNIKVQNGAILECNATGMINLPPNFQIDGDDTSIDGSLVPGPATPGVSANSLNVLTHGPTSNADALHTHTGISGATSVVFDMTASEVIAVGAPVVAFDSGGANNAKNGNATTGVASEGDIVGLAYTAAGGAGVAFKVQTSGALAMSTGIFDAPPTNANRGKRVYCSTTSGLLTLTPPSTAGNFIQKVGTIVSVVSGTVTVNVQIGDQVIL